MWNDGLPAVPATLTARIQIDLESVLLVMVLVGLVALGITVIARTKRGLAEEEPRTFAGNVEDYRVLMEQGILDAAEFERIRDRLEKKAPEPPPSPAPADPSAQPHFLPPPSPPDTPGV
jgi:hypothetical protein